MPNRYLESETEPSSGEVCKHCQLPIELVYGEWMYQKTLLCRKNPAGLSHEPMKEDVVISALKRSFWNAVCDELHIPLTSSIGEMQAAIVALKASPTTPGTQSSEPEGTPKVEEVISKIMQLVVFSPSNLRAILRPFFPSGSTAPEVLKAANELLDAMETCHDCKGSLVLQEHPVHCEDCSGDCENHEGPTCTTIQVLHTNLRRALKAAPSPDTGEANGWVKTATALPDDDSEVFAAIPWKHNSSGERKYLIHDCVYYEGGLGSQQKIFTDCEGEEFEAKDVDYWIYKHKLAEQLPAPSSVALAEPTK